MSTNSTSTPPNTNGTVTLAVVRQDQVTAFAVVNSAGVDLSLLLGPTFTERYPRPRTGDLVAILDDRIVYVWQRALVLRVLPEGLRLRLSDGTQAITPPQPATLDATTLRTGEPVFTSRTAVVARAWPWYEPQLPSAALQAYAATVVAGEAQNEG